MPNLNENLKDMQGEWKKKELSGNRSKHKDK